MLNESSRWQSRQRRRAPTRQKLPEVRQRHLQVPPRVKGDKDPEIEAPPSWTASKALNEWKQRCQRWANEVYDNEKSFTPTAEQAEVLRVVHARVT